MIKWSEPFEALSLYEPKMCWLFDEAMKIPFSRIRGLLSLRCNKPSEPLKGHSNFYKAVRKLFLEYNALFGLEDADSF